MKTLIEIFDLQDKVETLYSNMFNKYYSDYELFEWNEVSFFGGGNMNVYKSKIKELLLSGVRVKTGYRTSKMIRGSKKHFIFYK